MRNEFQANAAMHAHAMERARWAAVLGPARKPARPVRRSFWSLIFGF